MHFERKISGSFSVPLGGGKVIVVCGKLRKNYRSGTHYLYTTELSMYLSAFMGVIKSL